MTAASRGDPGFRRLGEDGAWQITDDLRLTAVGPGASAGVDLPVALRGRDPFDVPGSPSVGAYRGGSRLQVGVDGRRAFPLAD